MRDEADVSLGNEGTSLDQNIAYLNSKNYNKAQSKMHLK